MDVDLVAALAEMPKADVENTLDELERNRFITYEGGRYVFLAQLVVQVVRSECLTRGNRRRLRQRLGRSGSSSRTRKRYQPRKKRFPASMWTKPRYLLQPSEDSKHVHPLAAE